MSAETASSAPRRARTIAASSPTPRRAHRAC
jgi:hypothetical protein